MRKISSKPLKIALLQTGGEFWTGGTTYTNNLLRALMTSFPETIVTLISDEKNCDFVDWKNFSNEVMTREYSKPLILTNKVLRKFFKYDCLLSKTLNNIKTGKPDVVFPTKMKVRSDIAAIYWIPDFQFIHYPEMYQKNQIDFLKRSFKMGIENCTLLLLSSYDALNDLKNFMPEGEKKARVVNFVAHIPDNLYQEDLNYVIRKYNLPEKFFYLPNQFWKHKNHILVFKALRILRQKKIHPFVVMTGNPVDSRNPLYFAELMGKISEWGLRDQVAILGLVPHKDVYMLMRQAISVINPSLFEGWSTTVEEAKSIGKKVLLSNINVHREQNPPSVKYFPVDDEENLAEIMEEEWRKGKSGPDYKLEEMAKRELPERMKSFAENFLSVCNEAVNIKRRNG